MMTSAPTTLSTLYLPEPLRDQADGVRELHLSAPDVATALEQLVQRYPRLRRHLFTDSGRLRGFVNVYRNEDVVPPGAEPATPLAAGDVITIVPSIAGG